MSRRKINFTGSAAAILIFIAASTLLAAGQTAITTYHNDNNRTGWNPNETTLTPANAIKATFGLQHSVTLDDQVDGQPLFVPAVTITAGHSGHVHDVVYVATEGNTIYAIDAEAGTVLLEPELRQARQLPTRLHQQRTQRRHQLHSRDRPHQQHAVRRDLHPGLDRPRLSAFTPSISAA